MNVLFICFNHQKTYFLNSHACKLEELGIRVEFLLLDESLIAASWLRRSPVGVLLHIAKILRSLFACKHRLVITITPTVGLSTLIALKILMRSKITHVHWFTGQVWCNFTGIQRGIFRGIDKLLSDNAKILVDGLAQKEFLISEGFKAARLTVLGHGSICGVDAQLLSVSRSPRLLDARKIRIGVVGRINADKGVIYLMDALDYSWMSKHSCQFHFYGEIDGLSRSERDRFFDFVDNGFFYYHGTKPPLIIYQNIDILLLPSYREGFSNVVIEAQAAGIPVVCRNIYALKSTFIDKITGLSFSSVSELKGALESLLDSEVRDQFGAHGRLFAKQEFLRSVVVERITEFYVDNANFK